MSRFSVALIDDHPVLTGALASVLAAQPDVATVFTAASLDEGRRLLARERPELAVIDVRLDRDDGLALLRELPLVSPQTRAVVLTAHPQTAVVERAQVTLRGDGFTPDADLAVTLDGAGIDSTITVGSDGSLPGSARITLPSGTSIGTHTLRLATGSIAATVALRVTAAPTATILTPSVRPGEAIAYDLTGYIGVGGAPQKVAVVVNEKVLTCVQAGGDGVASGLTALPADLTGTVVVGFNVGLSCVLPPAGVINDQPISRLAPSVTVSDSAPVLSAVAISGKLVVTGAGFTAGKSVRVRVGDTDAGTLTADAEGRISGQLTAPTASAGQRVLADDGTRTAGHPARRPRTAAGGRLAADSGHRDRPPTGTPDGPGRLTKAVTRPVSVGMRLGLLSADRPRPRRRRPS